MILWRGKFWPKFIQILPLKRAKFCLFKKPKSALSLKTPHIKNLKLSQTRAGFDLSFPSSIWSQKSSRLLRYAKALWASAAILLSTRLPWVVPWPWCFRLSPRARTAKYTLSSNSRSVTICFFWVRVLSFAFVRAAFNAFFANTLVSLAWLLWWAKVFACWALTCLDYEN